jgi:hypothetical protein
MNPAVKVAAIVLAVIVVGWLGLRDLGYLASREGRCAVAAQPLILIGGSPSFVTALECA